MTKRIFTCLVLLFCIGLWLPTSAFAAAQLQSDAVLASDGSCQVSLSLIMDSEATAWEFPIPGDATDILLNGEAVTARSSGSRQWISGIGTRAVIRYTLPQAVVLNGSTATVTLSLLDGFSYPIDSMEFSVSLPGNILDQPQFTSGYYQQQITQSITYQLDGNTLSGSLLTPLKDHETLTLTLRSDRTAFSQMGRPGPLLSPWEWAILGCIVLAAVYYCATLMPRLTRPVRCTEVPDGITAGELGTCLTACGTDLTMLVLSWAQLGYLTVEIDGEDHVTLRKRMEMGNERSDLEVRCFQDLFHRRSAVDGTGMHYARIHRKIAGKSVLLRQLYLPNSGSPQLFRLLITLPAIVFGVQMGVSLGGNAGVKTVLAILLALLCAVLSYFIQSGGKCLPLRDKTPLLLCLGCGLLWLVPGIASDCTAMSVIMVLLQFFAGIAAAYGGKRSPLGVQTLAHIRGLRHHLRTAKTSELQVLMDKNPDYFYEMAPYALALGLDRRFARNFGKTALPESSYLDVGTHRPMTAAQWAAELRYAADILNKRQKHLPYPPTN